LRSRHKRHDVVIQEIGERDVVVAQEILEREDADADVVVALDVVVVDGAVQGADILEVVVKDHYAVVVEEVIGLNYSNDCGKIIVVDVKRLWSLCFRRWRNR
jgi:hypothetical protein